uniref:Uncharacterized protein n=1 Tax=Arion vulgaris TaxID=1028688 RepID=A0A0B7AL66_9EUPU
MRKIKRNVRIENIIDTLKQHRLSTINEKYFAQSQPLYLPMLLPGNSRIQKSNALEINN